MCACLGGNMISLVLFLLVFSSFLCSSLSVATQDQFQSVGSQLLFKYNPILQDQLTCQTEEQL